MIATALDRFRERASSTMGIRMHVSSLPSNKLSGNATTKAKHTHSEVKYEIGDMLVFGPETRGLPETS